MTAPTVKRRERPLVLVVDDVPPVIRMMTLELNAQGFDVVGARVGDDTYRTIEKYEPDVAVMEVMLPGGNGLELMADVKRRFGLPVIFVTTNSNEADREYALQYGADDYIIKPFAPSDLSARIKSVLPGEQKTDRRDQLRIGDLEIDLGRRVIRRDGTAVQLSTNEWALLFALAAERGTPVSARDLLITVWGGDFAADTRYLEIWIRRLRAKIEEDAEAPRIIGGNIERGYMLGRSAAGDERASA